MLDCRAHIRLTGEATQRAHSLVQDIYQPLNVGQGRRLGHLDRPVDDELSFVAVEREEGFEITREETRRVLVNFVSRRRCAEGRDQRR
jgi:hypothetical protein